ncbi:hypothetical protein [Listeria booriae]|uniref:hypothetical protein n=1 Tax=Listeria booriae TaxID=1552123 RepID=UPI00164DE387|nr:hypothetical protein [Listeria booriae]MBC6300331.1 hypothetical protein [Listeria booriae]
MKIDILIDDVQIKEELQKKLDNQWSEMLFLWDIEEMEKRMCMGRTKLNEWFLKDPRMERHMRRKSNGKKWWFYKESIETMKEIMDEW